ncbi:hypothetical protein [Streptomyces sp. NPDC020996]|uniref:hypothetical protein n=1 Tax=Streptomyces sp. NPDC020996 TaxID=3154791 RepID=UPI0033ECC740
MPRRLASAAAVLGLTTAGMALTVGTAEAASCNSACGSGYSVIDSMDVGEGNTFLTCNSSTGYNCVVTVSELVHRLGRRRGVQLHPRQLQRPLRLTGPDNDLVEPAAARRRSPDRLLAVVRSQAGDRKQGCAGSPRRTRAGLSPSDALC